MTWTARKIKSLPDGRKFMKTGHYSIPSDGYSRSGFDFRQKFAKIYVKISFGRAEA